MKKLFLIIALMSVPVMTFAAGKDLGGRNDDRDESRPAPKKEEPMKNISRPNDRGKDIRPKPGREQGKDIDRPRLRPDVHQPPRHNGNNGPRLRPQHGGSVAAQPVIINNNNNNVVQTTQAVAVAPTPIVVQDTPVYVQSVPETKPETVVISDPRPRRGYWDEGMYLGFDLRIGAGRMNQSRFDYDETEDPIGVAFDLAFGYKLPYFRVGAEIGFGGYMTEVTPPYGWEKEEDSMASFTLMPHIFLDLDLPGRVAPYVGFAAGLGVTSATYDFFWFSNSYEPDESHTKSAANFTYAIMAGLRIAVIPEMEVNLGYRFQDYGNVKLFGYDNSLKGHEVNLGLAFKF